VPQPSSGTVDEYLAYALSNNNSGDGEYVTFATAQYAVNTSVGKSTLMIGEG